MSGKTGAKTDIKPSLALSENAIRVLEKRYLKKDDKGNITETPEDMFRRVAGTVAAAELIYDDKADVTPWEGEFYRLMTSLEFLPNSPTLLNAGREPGQLSACFVLPVDDSVESIFNAVKQTAIIHKSGGGTGFSFSRVRPADDQVGGQTGIARGTADLINVFSAAADYIRQGGVRRGCNSVVLNVDHPDILKFTVAKDDPDILTNFYISIVVTKAFMEAVKSGADYDLINPHTGQVTGRLNARMVFDKIVDQAWKTGDPGLVFIDRINEDNPTPLLGKIENISGCGEQTLLPYESCNLGSINLARMVRSHGRKSKIDYEKLARTVRTAVRFLDNVIDINKFPLPEIEEVTKTTRKIGLGVMGFADMLLQIGASYNSEDALKAAADIMRCVQEEAHNTSAELAQERGAFPAFAGSIYDVPGGHKMRNASSTTIAPTGTLSLIAGCSSGIEPTFAVVFVRNILDGEQLLEINPIFEEAAKKEGFHSGELLEQLVTSNQLHMADCVPDKTKNLFATAHKISPQWHIEIQAAFQKYTDNAVSKTVNLPHEATRLDMAGVFMRAYENGLKGITAYRDGSRELQPLSTGDVGLDLVRRYLARNSG
jgi:ribonucleoside-diphosphate reductase alpha chain